MASKLPQNNYRCTQTMKYNMKRKTIIVIITPGKEPETWGNLKKACEAKGWNYNTLSKRKMPIEFEDSTIYRLPFL